MSSSYPEDPSSSEPPRSGAELPAKPLPQNSDEMLPPVRPPSGAFILQLFLIPLVIVGIIVMVWMMFSWLAHMGSDPRDLVKDLRKLNDGSWQKAYTLTNLLRNPEYDHLKEDEQLAAELAEVLDEQLTAGGSKEAAVRLRMFLARALGEFRVTTGLPVLLRAAELEQSEADVGVRRAALEALAVLAGNVGPETLRSPDVMEVLFDASVARSPQGPSPHEIDDLRSTAAFTLGVIQGPEAMERLAVMLTDAYPNARYNAATGLARHGDPRGLDVLLEMIDPDNPRAVASESTEEGRRIKRHEVIASGLLALRRLTRENPELDLTSAERALQRLVDSDLEMAVRLRAKETRLTLRKSADSGPED